MFHKNNNISYEVPFKINHKNPCLSFLKISACKTPPPRSLQMTLVKIPSKPLPWTLKAQP